MFKQQRPRLRAEGGATDAAGARAAHKLSRGSYRSPLVRRNLAARFNRRIRECCASAAGLPVIVPCERLGLDQRDARLHPGAAVCARRLEELPTTASSFAHRAVAEWEVSLWRWRALQLAVRRERGARR
jgi:hypothetical protein